MCYTDVRAKRKQVKILHEPVAVRCHRVHRFYLSSAEDGNKPLGMLPEKVSRQSRTESEYVSPFASVVFASRAPTGQGATV